MFNKTVIVDRLVLSSWLLNDERSQQHQDQKSRGMQMPLHTETMYGHPFAETVASPVRPATNGNFAVLDVRQRVPNIPGKYIQL